jgi:site-specific recombinase XerC
LAVVELASPTLASPALPSLQDQLACLNSLATTLSRSPALSDPLGSWLSADLTKRLSQVGALTLQQLIGFINLHHHRWWTQVPRLGQARADRILAWLMPLAEALQLPLKEVACKPLMQLTLARASTLARLDPASQKRFGIVPLDRLAVPPEIDGRHGLFRIPGDNTLGVNTDLEAIFAWLRRHQESPRTSASYGRIVERFYLWCLWVQKKALSSLVEDDFHDYRRFLSKPPADWVQAQRAGRDMTEWRPFKGPLSQSSQKLNFSVISALLSGLISAGYIRANAAAGVLPAMKLQHFGLNIDRTFDDAQWSWVMQCWQVLYDKCGPGAEAETATDRSFMRAAGLRRTRLILELGATTGLRLIELVTTRRGALKREVVDGQAIWILKVVGKGFKPREVLVFDDIKELIDQHHRDMAMAGTGFDAKNSRVRALLNPDARLESNLRDGQTSAALPFPVLANDGRADASGEVASDPTQLPLIGALRKAPPKWTLNGNGVAIMDRSASSNADRYGSLDPTALYQSLKRFLGTCCELAEAAGAAINHEALGRASTHWLRHFFANSAAADNVMPAALMAAMGHSSLQTTSIYLRTERRLVVSEMSKMRRRA